MIYEERIANRRNLITVWLDYKKAFDSVPHSWIIKSLQLAKVPEPIINAIHMLMNKWKTKVYLYGEHSTIETDYIEYMKGILQGDLMSQILFVPAVNPLSLLLSRKDGYKIGKTVRNKIPSHLFFVDDLKLYAFTIMQMKKLLDIVTQFTRDVGMSFGESKCAYQMIERGKRKEVDEPLHMNGLKIKEVAEGDH